MMSYNKTILCLADSRKMSGCCIAGKEWDDGTTGQWIRPVSERQAEEISIEDRRYEDGTLPRVLDVVSIEMKVPKPTGFQPENHVIDDGFYWRKVAQGTWEQVIAAVDNAPGSLWLDGDSSYNGRNDQIHLATVGQNLNSSLRLVRTRNLSLSVAMEGPPERRKRKVRANFIHNGQNYCFSVTDRPVEERYLKGPDGLFPVGDAVLCISLSEPFNGYTYKLVASVITPGDVGERHG
jgi:hypothetical protein